MLHITNGASANQVLEKAGLKGRFLSWDDPLHHGPVPGGLGLADMSEVRAEFIATNGWATPQAARQRFAERDQALGQGAKAGQVVIWNSFELFDQLQLLQVLDWFHGQDVSPPAVVWVEDYLGGTRLNAAELQGLHQQREVLDPESLEQASVLWQAFGSDDPSRLDALRREDLARFPFMAEGLARLLAEYPHVTTGLSLTQAHIMEALDDGPLLPGMLFGRAQDLEPRRFMGDWSFWLELEHLLTAEDPPVANATGQTPVFPPRMAPDAPAFRQQRFEVTEAGRRLLEGSQSLRPTWERWVGGVRLDPGCRWRWNPEIDALVEAPPG